MQIRGVVSIYGPTPMRTAEIRDFLNDDAKTLSFARFCNPLFLPLFQPLFFCRLPKIIEKSKISNSMLHFPSHLFVELPLGNSHIWHFPKWHFPDPRFKNFLSALAPRPSMMARFPS